MMTATVVPEDAWRAFEAIMPRRQLLVLHAVRDGKTHPQASIVQATGLAQPHASRALKELVAKGFLVRVVPGWRLVATWAQTRARLDHAAEQQHAHVEEVLHWLKD